MITDEMRNAILDAVQLRRSSDVDLILKAVAPLIAARVIEECLLTGAHSGWIGPNAIEAIRREVPKRLFGGGDDYY